MAKTAQVMSQWTIRAGDKRASRTRLELAGVEARGRGVARGFEAWHVHARSAKRQQRTLLEIGLLSMCLYVHM